MSDDINEMLRVAESAARRAGAFLLEERGRVSTYQLDEKRKNDFVTDVDRNTEKIIVDHILAAFPTHQFLGEEGGLRENQSDYVWVIDPLDGTTNYVRGLPVFCSSIALMHDGKVIVGVVHNPLIDEMFTATIGGGAFLNREKINVSRQSDFSRAMLSTGFPHQTKHQIPPYFTAAAELFHQTAGLRRMGAAAIDLCYTACGRFEGYWEQGMHIWDIAAGCLLITEAGGVVSDFNNSDTYLDSGYIIAANPDIHQSMYNIISVHFSGESHG